MKTLIKLFCICLFWFSCNQQNQDIVGCLDSLACNYNPDANMNDDSCIFYDVCGECGGDGTDIDNDNICDDIDDCISIDNCGNCENQAANYVEIFDECYDVDINELFFNNMNLNLLPEEIGLFNNLEILDLSFNNLSSLPESFSNLSNLKNLNLSSNDFSFLPNNIRDLINLEELQLSFNQIDTLSSIFDITTLKKLNLNFNNLDTLSSDIGNLLNLEFLNLQNNQLVYLPATMCNFSQNCYIVVAGNNLCDKYKHDCFDWGFNDIYWGSQNCNN